MPGKLVILDSKSSVENILNTALAVTVEDLVHPETTDDGERTIVLPAKSEIPPETLLNNVQIIRLSRHDFLTGEVTGPILHPDIPDGTTVKVKEGALLTFAGKDDQVYAFFLDSEEKEREIFFKP